MLGFYDWAAPGSLGRNDSEAVIVIFEDGSAAPAERIGASVVVQGVEAVQDAEGVAGYD